MPNTRAEIVLEFESGLTESAIEETLRQMHRDSVVSVEVEQS